MGIRKKCPLKNGKLKNRQLLNIDSGRNNFVPTTIKPQTKVSYELDVSADVLQCILGIKIKATRPNFQHSRDVVSIEPERLNIVTSSLCYIS